MNAEQAQWHEIKNPADPPYRLKAVEFVLQERERELLAIKGPCSNKRCRLHYAHYGPCDEAKS